MKTSDILYILTEHDLNKVRNAFDKYIDEFEAYKNSLLKKGSSIHFNIKNDKEFVFTNAHLSKIGLLFVKNIFSELEINFIVDSIVSSINNFENKTIEEELELFTDPEVNGHLNKEKIKKKLNIV